MSVISTYTDARQAEHAGVEHHLTHFLVMDSEDDESDRSGHCDCECRDALSGDR
jgi:hypothetical protein